MYHRILQKPLDIGKLLERAQIFFMIGVSRKGPRGTGKTTWLKERLSGSNYIDLAAQRSLSLRTDLLARSGEARRHESWRKKHHGMSMPYDRWVVIDEVQRVPEKRLGQQF